MRSGFFIEGIMITDVEDSHPLHLKTVVKILVFLSLIVIVS
jgi:hypothetical protein